MQAKKGQSSIPLLSKKSSLLKSLSRLQDLSDLIFNQLCIPILNESPWCFGFMLSGMLSIKRTGLAHRDCIEFWDLKVIVQVGHSCINWDVQWFDLNKIDCLVQSKKTKLILVGKSLGNGDMVLNTRVWSSLRKKIKINILEEFTLLELLMPLL